MWLHFIGSVLSLAAGVGVFYVFHQSKQFKPLTLGHHLLASGSVVHQVPVKLASRLLHGH
jgi:hypothetical protein